MTWLTRTLPALAVGACGFVVAVAEAVPAQATELVVLQRPGCVWCLRWEQEIAPAYPKTAEGKRAPLRRVDVTQPWPADLNAVSVDVYTPTFVLVDEGKEIARLRGYPGSEFFWALLDEMLNALP